jgi:hypothetical protein
VLAKPVCKGISTETASMTLSVSTLDPAIRAAPLIARLIGDAQDRGLDVRALRAWLRAPFSRQGCVRAHIADLSARPRGVREETELRLAHLIAALSSTAGTVDFAVLHASALAAVHALEQPEAPAA